jgi:hypothetical protein
VLFSWEKFGGFLTKKLGKFGENKISGVNQCCPVIAFHLLLCCAVSFMELSFMIGFCYSPVGYISDFCNGLKT